MFRRLLGDKSKSPSESSETEAAAKHLKRMRLADASGVVPVVTMMEISDAVPTRLVSPSKSLRRKNEEKKQAMLQTLKDQMTRYREDFSRRSNDPHFEFCDP